MARREREYYMEDGNAARKLRSNAAPERRRRYEEYPQQSPRRSGPKTYAKSAKIARDSKGFDLGYTVVLVLMLAMLIASCVIMLSVQGDVEKKERRIESLQQELQDIEADNAAYENKLGSMYSLEDIYNIATNELGMVYSENGQIIYYENENGDYVKQYGDVPKTVD